MSSPVRELPPHRVRSAVAGGHWRNRIRVFARVAPSAGALAVTMGCASGEPAPSGPSATTNPAVTGVPSDTGAAPTSDGLTGVNPSSTDVTSSGPAVTGSGDESAATSNGETSGEPSTASSAGSDSMDGEAHSWNGCEEFRLPEGCSIPEDAVLPGELRCTGLYSNFEARQLRCGVKEYTPAFELWSDGAAKKRYVWLPPGTTIDVTNPDEFDYPVGTRFWKEFYVGPEGQQKLGETRYLLRADVGWLYTVYVWDQAGVNAEQHNEGVDDLFGTGHSVPSREQCKACHQGRVNFVLGWDFFMLGEGAHGATARELADAGVFSGLDPAWLELTVPGDAIESAALGYLHANCGISCHNTTLDAAANPSGLYMRLLAGFADSPQSTDTVSAINQRPAPNAETAGIPNPGLEYFDFRPLDPERSLVLARMSFRGTDAAMPPVGSHVVHQAGVDAVKAWIEAMTEERGYPSPLP